MTLHRLTELEKVPSSEFKILGWRGVYDRLIHSNSGALAITNHRRQQGVLLTTGEYERLVELASLKAPQEEDALEALRREFDQHLAGLADSGAADRMRRAAKEPLELNGEFRVGDSH